MEFITDPESLGSLQPFDTETLGAPDPWDEPWGLTRGFEVGGMSEEEAAQSVTQSRDGLRYGPGQASQTIGDKWGVDLATEQGARTAWLGETKEYLKHYNGDGRLAAMAWVAGVPAVDRYLKNGSDPDVGPITLKRGEDVGPSLTRAWQLAQAGGAPAAAAGPQFITDPESLSSLQPKKQHGFFGKLKQAAYSGLDTTSDAVAMIFGVTGLIGPKAMAEWIKDPGLADPDYFLPGYEKFERDFNDRWNAEDYVGAAGVVWDNIGKMPEIIAQSLGTSALPLGAAVAGAVATIPTGVGAVGGAMAGLGSGSAIVEGGAMLLEEFHKHGIDVKDEAQLADALSNEALMAEIKEKAVKAGAIVGAVDAFTLGLAGKTIQAFGGKGLIRKALVGAGEAGVQMAGGAGGEALKQVATEGGVTNPHQVFIEAAAELGMVVPEVAIATAARGGRAALTRKQAPGEEPPEDGAPPSAPPPEDEAPVDTVVSEAVDGAEDSAAAAAKVSGLNQTAEALAETGAPAAAEAPAPGGAVLTEQPDEPGIGQAPVEDGVPAPAGQTTAQGFGITIETPKGGVRRSKEGAEIEWEVRDFPTDYGYIEGTVAGENEPLDVFLGPQKDTAPNVLVIDQINPHTGAFDELKVMFGYDDLAQAKQDYVHAFSDASGAARIGAATPLTVEQFREFVRVGDMTKPLAYQGPTTQSGAPSLAAASAPAVPTPSMGGGGRATPEALQQALRAAQGVTPEAEAGDVETIIEPDAAQQRQRVWRSPQDVLRTVAEKGLRDTGGHNLTEGRGAQVFVPGKGMLIREGGLSVDEMGEVLFEEGFFSERPTEADVLEMLDRALAGEEIYSDRDIGEVQARQAQAQAADDKAVLRAAIGEVRRVAEENNMVLTEEEIVEIASEVAGSNTDPLDAISDHQERAAYEDTGAPIPDVTEPGETQASRAAEQGVPFEGAEVAAGPAAGDLAAREQPGESGGSPGTPTPGTPEWQAEWGRAIAAGDQEAIERLVAQTSASVAGTGATVEEAAEPPTEIVETVDGPREQMVIPGVEPIVPAVQPEQTNLELEPDLLSAAVPTSGGRTEIDQPRPSDLEPAADLGPRADAAIEKLRAVEGENAAEAQEIAAEVEAAMRTPGSLTATEADIRDVERTAARLSGERAAEEIVVTEETRRRMDEATESAKQQREGTAAPVEAVLSDNSYTARVVFGEDAGRYTLGGEEYVPAELKAGLNELEIAVAELAALYGLPTIHEANAATAPKQVMWAKQQLSGLGGMMSRLASFLYRQNRGFKNAQGLGTRDKEIAEVEARLRDTAGNVAGWTQEREEALQAPAPVATVPTFEDFSAALPKDEDGNPDFEDAGSDAFYRTLGRETAVWAELSDAEKVAVVEEAKTLVEEEIAARARQRDDDGVPRARLADSDITVEYETETGEVHEGRVNAQEELTRAQERVRLLSELAGCLK